MTPSNPAGRIRLIEQSLRCFVYAWFSLIPVIGLVAAFSTLRLYSRTRLSAGDQWNPADGYRAAGFWLAVAGIFISLAALSLILIVVFKSFGF